MNKVLESFKSKTKLVAIAMAFLVALKTQGVITVTPEIWQVLEAAGLYFLRDAVGRVKG